MFPPRSLAGGSPVLELSVSMLGLTATSSRRTLANTPHPPCLPLPLPLPHSRPQLTLFRRVPSTGKSGSASCQVPAPFPWVLVGTRFCLCPPSLCFPQSCGSSVIKSRKPSSLGIPSPSARSPGWGVCCGTENLHIRARISLV